MPNDKSKGQPKSYPQVVNVSEVIFGEPKELTSGAFEVSVSVFVVFGKDKPVRNIQGQFLINGEPWKNWQRAVLGRFSEKLTLRGKKINISIRVKFEGREEIFPLKDYDLPEKKKKGKKVHIQIFKTFDSDNMVVAVVFKKDENEKRLPGKIFYLDNADDFIPGELDTDLLMKKFNESATEVDKMGLAFISFKKGPKKRRAMLLSPENPNEFTRFTIKQRIEKKNGDGKKDKDKNNEDDEEKGVKGEKSLSEKILDAFVAGQQKMLAPEEKSKGASL
jgi:hypothetical protein